MEERSAEMGVLAVRIAALGLSKIPCGVVRSSSVEVMGDELE